MAKELLTIDDVQEQLYNDLVDSFFNDNKLWKIDPSRDMYKAYSSWYYRFSCSNSDDTFGADISEMYDSNEKQDDKVIMTIWCTNKELGYHKSIELDKNYRNAFHQRMLEYLGIHAQNKYNLLCDIRNNKITHMRTYYFNHDDMTAFDIVNWCKKNLTNNEYYFEWKKDFNRDLDSYHKEKYLHRSDSDSIDKLDQVKFYTSSKENLITLEMALVDHIHYMYQYFNKTSESEHDKEDLRFLKI